MKKMIKLRVFATNVFRIISSFLFVNMSFLFNNRALGNSVNPFNVYPENTCYARGPVSPAYMFRKVFILLVPIAIVIAVIIIVYKKRKKSGKEKKDDKQD